jgi:hypothetical protein
MTDFDNIDALYEYVEDTVLTDENFRQTIDLFKKFRDTKREENNQTEAERAQWEIHCLSFLLREGEIGPQWQQTDENGQVFVYPHLDLFDERTYEYLIMRLDTTDHPKFKSQYAHILWGSPKKHGRFAKVAVDSYLEMISIYEQKYDEGEDCSREISEAVINAYSIARRINYRVEESKSELKRLIQKFSSGAAFFIRDLIQFMLKPKKGFNQDDFEGLENVCWQIAESFTDGHTAISFLELGERVDRRLEKQSHNWILRIAQHYETMMKMREADPLVALHFCMEAIGSYKRICDEQKVEELEQRYAELKDSVEFKTSEIEVDLTEIVKNSRKVAKDIIKNGTSEDIIAYLILDKHLLPTYHDVRKSVEEQVKESPTLHLLSKSISDQSKNTAQHFESEEEKGYFSILESYKSYLELGYIHLINEVLIAAILERKLTIGVLLNFLNKHCWYGKDLIKRLPDGRTSGRNWLNLIAPALNEYFGQVDFHLADPTHNYPNFVLCLDSLTLKIEGLFRDLCQLSGVVTSRQRRDNSGKNVTLEKDIDALLREEAVTELFDEDDLLFFKFVLVEKAGYNLRHKIAHSLMSFQDYNWFYMNLMILVLLRLGKYNFAEAEEGAVSDS